MENNNQRVIREYNTFLKATPERVFPLLCPVREYAWLPHWRCEMLYSQSGFAEAGCVFATDFHNEYGRETWVVSHYEISSKIGFVRIGGKRTTRYEILLAMVNGGSEITWRQEITGLGVEGQSLVAGYTQEHFLNLMIPLNQMLDHYLQTGEMLHLNLLPVGSGTAGRDGT
ncbi:MAG: hypothetical protein V2B20_17730 [Pseudomonadota bacterium]